MKYSSKSITNVGKVRSANEDNFGEALTPNGHLFVVCDGMGGHVGGAEASKIAVNSMIEFFQKEVYDNVILAIDGALNFANEQIYASALSNPDLKGMGTTAVVLLIRDEECFIGHVGDSRIYLRSDGKLNRITKDHSFVQTLVDSGVINDEDAENHPNKNQILQALGIAPTVKGTICQSPILPKVGDMFLMCSDGLNGMVTDRDIEKIMKEDNLMVTSENLITAALNGGGHDNVTATLVLIEESQHAQSRFVHFNPKPKAIDMTSTQQFGGGVNTEKPKNNKLPYIIGGGVLLIGIGITAFMMMGKEEEKEKIAHKKYTLESLENATDCENIVVGDRVVVEKDTMIRIKCKSDSLLISIENNVIKSKTTIEKPKQKNVQSDDNLDDKKDGKDEKSQKTNNSQTKKLIEMSGGEIEKLQKNENVDANDGVHTLKNKYVVEVKDGKVDHLKILYRVKDGDGLEKIVQKFKSKVPDLTKRKIQSENENNQELTEKERTELTQDESKVPMNKMLEIPFY